MRMPSRTMATATSRLASLAKNSTGWAFPRTPEANSRERTGPCPRCIPSNGLRGERRTHPCEIALHPLHFRCEGGRSRLPNQMKLWKAASTVPDAVQTSFQVHHAEHGLAGPARDLIDMRPSPPNQTQGGGCRGARLHAGAGASALPHREGALRETAAPTRFRVICASSDIDTMAGGQVGTSLHSHDPDPGVLDLRPPQFVSRRRARASTPLVTRWAAKSDPSAPAPMIA